MDELKRAIELAFAEEEVPCEKFESNFERFIYTEVRCHVLDMRRDQLTREIAMLESFKSRIKNLAGLAE